MPERSTISQVVQWGVESTPGTSVAANRKLPSLALAGGIRQTMQTFRGAGAKYPAVAAQGKEWSEWALSGPATFEELVYPLSSVLMTPTPVQMAATPAYAWDFAPSSVSEDTVKTFTIEQGSGVRAHKFTNALASEFGLNFTREEVTVSGRMIGRQLQDGVTLTAGPTEVGIVPVLPAQVSVYLDSTNAALGTTKLLRALQAEWSMQNRFAPVWPLDAAQSSFAATVENEPGNTVRLLLEADAAGMARVPVMRAGTTEFLRIEAVGATISGANTYLLRLDFAVKWTEVDDFSDEDGVYAIRYTGTVVHDATWAKAMAVRVQNTRTAL